MAYFKLSLLFLGDNQYVNNAIEYLPSVISEFYSQTEERESRLQQLENWTTPQKNTFCFTYNEQFSIHSNSRKDLTFSMDRMVLINNEWVENPYAQHLQIGTQLLLEDKYNNQYLLTVSKIAYTFKLNNITYNITCQDTFNYQLTRQNDGYEIENNSSEDDFIGAKDIDWWVNKIAKECHIAYQYIPLEQSLYQNTDKRFLLTTGQQYGNQLQKLIKQSFDRTAVEDKPLFEKIPFSGSGNAASILINLGEQLGLVLKTFEHFQYNNGIESNILIRYFWFEPAKNNIVSGLQYSPFDSVQQFSLTHDGAALTTVLNVSGPTYEDELITLLPDISPFFLQLFQSEQWERSHYYPSMYSDLMNATTYHYNKLSGGDFEIANVGASYLNDNIYHWNNDNDNAATTAIYTNIIDASAHDYVLLPIHDHNQQSFYIPGIYDNLSFNTNQQVSSITISGSETKQFFAGDTKWGLFEQIKLENNKYRIQEIRSDHYGQQIENAFIGINVGTGLFNDTAKYDDVNIYMQFNRTPTVDDEEFATIADQIPWLENKIIDFSYFTNHNLLNKYQFSLLSKSINDDLRIINGKLIWYTKEYYQALHKKTETLANIQNMIDALSATFNYEIVDSYRRTGHINSLDNFQKMYTTIISAWHIDNKEPILDYDETISSYLTKYFNAQQRFYKNIKNFRDYFEAPVTFISSDGELTRDVVTLINHAENDSEWRNNEELLTHTSIYSTFNFENGNDITLLNNTFTDYDPTTWSPNINIYNRNDLSNLDIVTGTNYQNGTYNYAVKVGGKDFYYQDNQQAFDIKQKYYIPMVLVEIQTNTPLPGVDDEGYNFVSIQYNSGLSATLYTYKSTIISKVSTNTSDPSNNNYIYHYRVWAWAPYGLIPLENWYNTISELSVDPYQLITPYEIVWIQATTNLMIKNYLSSLGSGEQPVVFKRNKDTYIPWSDDNNANYLTFGTQSAFQPLYTQYPWLDEYTTSNLWYRDNEKTEQKDKRRLAFKETYFQFLPLTEIYFKGLNYQLETNWNIRNNQGLSLYDYLKAHTIGNTSSITNPFAEERYIRIPVANQENYTSFYHYVNHYQVSKGVATGLGIAAGIVTYATFGLGGWWLALGANIAAVCMAVQKTANAAVLENTGEGKYLLEPPLNTNLWSQRPSSSSWTSDLILRPNGFAYATQNDAIKVYQTYRQAWNGDWSNIKFNWNNSTQLPTTKIGEAVITPAMFTNITEGQEDNYNLTFTYKNQTSYWQLTKGSTNQNNYWNYWKYFVPTSYFLNELTSQNYLLTTDKNKLYVKERYYKIIHRDDIIDKNNSYYIIPLVRAYTNESGIWQHSDYNKKHNDELPYCILSEFVTNLNNWISGSNKSIYDQLVTKGISNAHWPSNCVSQIAHYPLVNNAEKFDLSANSNWKTGVTTWGSIITNEDDVVITWPNSSNPDYFIVSYGGNFQSLCIIVQAQDYILQAYEPSIEDTDFKCYDANDIVFDWTQQNHFVQGLYIPAIYDDVVSAVTQNSFDPYGHYYNIYGQRVYTLQQLMSGQSLSDNIIPCILNTVQYEEVNLTKTKTTFILPVIQTIHTVTYERRGWTVSVESDENLYKIGDIYIDEINNKRGVIEEITISGNQYIYYILADISNSQNDWVLINSSLNKKSYTLTFTDDSKNGLSHYNKEIDNETVEYNIITNKLNDIHADNNGTFWYYYHENSSYPILFEIAAAIETQLQVYWSQAYNASLYCDYFLPVNWQPRVENEFNFFSAQIFTVDQNNLIQLNNTYVPYIEHILTPTNAVKMPRYQFKHISTINMSDFDENNYISIDQLPDINLRECFTNHNLSTAGWYAEELGTTNYYRIVAGGTTWSELLNRNLKMASTPLTEYTGIYPLLLKYFINAYVERSIFNYTQLKNEHDNIWKQLYTQFPSVVLEGNYTNDDATNSHDLLVLAQNEFKDKSYPERGYTITVIDNLSLLHGYEGQELRIGDSIALRANEFYDGFDDIKNSLSQYLFITDIKYTLRKDTDVSLTVNSIKYQDKMLQRLVKLIK